MYYTWSTHMPAQLLPTYSRLPYLQKNCQLTPSRGSPSSESQSCRVYSLTWGQTRAHAVFAHLPLLKKLLPGFRVCHQQPIALLLPDDAFLDRVLWQRILLAICVEGFAKPTTRKAHAVHLAQVLSVHVRLVVVCCHCRCLF